MDEDKGLGVLSSYHEVLNESGMPKFGYYMHDFVTNDLESLKMDACARWAKLKGKVRSQAEWSSPAPFPGFPDNPRV